MQALAPDAARAVIPRPASTVLVLRDSDAGPQVLMVKRSPHAKFMPGAYVFPGGAVDAADAEVACDEDTAVLARRIGEVNGVGAQAIGFAVAALRESFEESALWLGLDAPSVDLAPLRARLHAGESFGALATEARLPVATSALRPWSHWVTPLGLPRRFDTLFFVSRAPAGQTPSVDAGETTTLEWVSPTAALEAYRERRFPMEFATLSIVRSLLPFAARDVQACLDHADAQQALPAVHPRIRLAEDRTILGVMLPHEPGYEKLDGDGEPVAR